MPGTAGRNGVITMVVGVRGAKRVGTIWVKQYNDRTIASSGSELFIGGKFFPPYVVPEYYWTTIRWIGNDVGMVPDGGVWVSIRGGHVETNLNQEQVETDDITVDEMVGRYMKPESLRFTDTDDSNESGAGIPHDQQQRSSWWKRRQMFWYREIHCLPDGAVFNNADLILATGKFQKHGSLKKDPIAYDAPSFIGFGAAVDVIDANTDSGDILFGGLLDSKELYADILENVGPAESAETMVETNPPAALQKWMEGGYVTGGINIDQSVHVRTKLTVKCGVYLPHQTASHQLSPF